MLLKFLNQDFAKIIDFSLVKTDQSFDFIYEKEPEGSTFEPLTLEKVMDHSINSLLRLMYKTCKNQSQRIKDYLVQYKAAVSLAMVLMIIVVDHEKTYYKI